MPYHRDQVIASVTDYYHFLTRLHVQPQDIRRPPQPDGWSEISQKRFSRLGKTEKVVDLLKHLPYVQNDYNDDPILIWEVSGCNDYTGRQFQQDIIEGDTANYTPDDTSPDVCSCDKLREPHPHIVPLASPASNHGDYIFCDTEDGEFIVWDPWQDHRTFPSAEACFSYFKQKFIATELFPINKTICRTLGDSSNRVDLAIKQLLRKHGWPSDEFKWNDFINAARAEIEDFSRIASYE